MSKTLKTFICKDCSLGEKVPCTFTGLYEGQPALSCPYGKCGEDAVWVEKEEDVNGAYCCDTQWPVYYEYCPKCGESLHQGLR